MRCKTTQSRKISNYNKDQKVKIEIDDLIERSSEKKSDFRGDNYR